MSANNSGMTHTRAPVRPLRNFFMKEWHLHHTIWTRLSPLPSQYGSWDLKWENIFKKSIHILPAICAFSFKHGQEFLQIRPIRSLGGIYFITAISLHSLSVSFSPQPAQSRWERLELIRNKFPPCFTLEFASTVSFEKAASNFPLTRDPTPSKNSKFKSWRCRLKPLGKWKVDHSTDFNLKSSIYICYIHRKGQCKGASHARFCVSCFVKVCLVSCVHMDQCMWGKSAQESAIIIGDWLAGVCLITNQDARAQPLSPL